MIITTNMCGKFQALHLQTISVTLTYFEGHSDIEKVQMKVTFLLSIDPVEFKLCTVVTNLDMTGLKCFFMTLPCF